MQISLAMCATSLKCLNAQMSLYIKEHAKPVADLHVIAFAQPILRLTACVSVC